MIGFLRGKALRLSPEAVLLDVGGVGYHVHISLATYSELDNSGASGPLGLYIHTHAREGAIELFGFWTERERSLFERLIGVSGIGPRLARVILSGMAPDDLIGAIAAGDSARLTSIPGVGKKTAQRIVIDLKDRMPELGVDLEAIAGTEGEDDLLAALVNLGYRAKEAQAAVTRARR
ncbi:MAG: Holliday junction branch migration protein RuvA, partial [Acidobacteriota bacterium]|nr:Holliday junction branch migration protein RuvA [Acidobacteriota bacterium]